jgi:3-dehydroquinate dehydratase-1
MICVPILKKSIDSALKTADKSIKLGADILELRIDALENPDSDEIRNLLDNLDHRFIATNLKRAEGGFFKGSELERIEILVEVAESVDFVDIELQTEAKYRSKVIKASKSSIISYHDFDRTPSMAELLDVVEKEKKLGDFAKFAVTPRNMQDTLTVLEVLSRVSNTIGISMGELGKYTRVVAPLFGSPLTFASVDVESAPGQLDIHNIRKFLDQFIP